MQALRRTGSHERSADTVIVSLMPVPETLHTRRMFQSLSGQFDTFYLHRFIRIALFFRKTQKLFNDYTEMQALRRTGSHERSADTVIVSLMPVPETTERREKGRGKSGNRTDL